MTSVPHDEAFWLSAAAPEELRRIVDALYRAHRLLSAITDLDVLLERILEETKQVACAEACSLLLYDTHSQELYFRIALGEGGDLQTLKREIRLKLGQGIAGTAAARRESVNVIDVKTDGRFYALADQRSNFQTRNLLAIPLIDRDELVGVVEAVNKIGGPHFTDIDLRVMQMFSVLTATALANARLIEENLRAERLAALGQAVAGMSHHTKNILAGMTSSVDLIDQGLQLGNQEFLNQSWPVFKRCTERISNFVEDMLAYSKPRVPMRRPCDVKAIIQDASETFQGLLVVKKVQLDVDTSRLKHRANVDERAIYRCILNLLTNAADAVPREGGRICISAGTCPGGALCLEVSDNGPGIAENIRNTVFDPFFSTKGSEGTGLGLAVTRKIIEEHGGTVEIDTAPEGGALFRIRIPS
ncbi:MAG TPA: ATP-binding protein [Candidatus Hydrogenedentes bacterium]|nr:ATP-binding protein [Candidatus Hydrogenedentota bacterium]HQH53880.1 ATP-binding protein [Candidatus Hydrogenedentota bacterium]